jgi:hypothetical protein
VSTPPDRSSTKYALEWHDTVVYNATVDLPTTDIAAYLNIDPSEITVGHVTTWLDAHGDRFLADHTDFADVQERVITSVVAEHTTMLDMAELFPSGDGALEALIDLIAEKTGVHRDTVGPLSFADRAPDTAPWDVAVTFTEDPSVGGDST